jgi:hypothetical protein
VPARPELLRHQRDDVPRPLRVRLAQGGGDDVDLLVDERDVNAVERLVDVLGDDASHRVDDPPRFLVPPVAHDASSSLAAVFRMSSATPVSVSR